MLDEEGIDLNRPAFLIDADLIGAFVDVPVLLEVNACQEELSAKGTFPVFAHKVRD
jgi:hypothetical protein